MLKLKKLTLAAGIAGLLLATPALAKKTDAEKEKEWKEKVTKKYVEKKEGALFHDYSHWVDLKSLKDTRWTVTKDLSKMVKDLKAESGPQLHATWTLSAQSGGAAITMLVIKMPHKKGNSVFNQPFDNIGESIKVADAKKMHDAFYRDWVKASTDVVESKCVEPRKSKVGPASFYACAVATDKESKQREKREWYAWTTPNTTWILQVNYGKDVIDKEAVAEKAEAFVDAIDEVKDRK